MLLGLRKLFSLIICKSYPFANVLKVNDVTVEVVRGDVSPLIFSPSKYQTISSQNKILFIYNLCVAQFSAICSHFFTLQKAKWTEN